ncbi:MBL fold metallo-hydrolase [Paenibacillus tarimensis]
MSNVEQITNGFWRVCLMQPIPSDVYCYVVIKDKVTMIDCGHPSFVSQQALLNGINEIGLNLSDIDQLILTHLAC